MDKPGHGINLRKLKTNNTGISKSLMWALIQNTSKLINPDRITWCINHWALPTSNINSAESLKICIIRTETLFDSGQQCACISHHIKALSLSFVYNIGHYITRVQCTTCLQFLEYFWCWEHFNMPSRPSIWQRSAPSGETEREWRVML
jgi:hypothetical protein